MIRTVVNYLHNITEIAIKRAADANKNVGRNRFASPELGDNSRADTRNAAKIFLFKLTFCEPYP
jgi:hypothetical protein